MDDRDRRGVVGDLTPVSYRENGRLHAMTCTGTASGERLDGHRVAGSWSMPGTCSGHRWHHRGCERRMAWRVEGKQTADSAGAVPVARHALPACQTMGGST